MVHGKHVFAFYNSCLNGLAGIIPVHQHTCQPPIAALNYPQVHKFNDRGVFQFACFYKPETHLSDANGHLINSHS